MRRKSTAQSAFFNTRFLIGLIAVLAGVFLALFATSAQTRRPERAANTMLRWGGVQEEWVARYNNDGNTDVRDQTLSNNTAAEDNTAIPSGGSWTVTGSLNTARYFHTATLLPNGMVLVAGGQTPPDGFPSASAELYDPATASWTATGDLNTARVLYTATLLPNGMVLVSGGQDSTFTPTSSAELYDPASGVVVTQLSRCNRSDSIIGPKGNREKTT